MVRSVVVQAARNVACWAACRSLGLLTGLTALALALAAGAGPFAGSAFAGVAFTGQGPVAARAVSRWQPDPPSDPRSAVTDGAATADSGDQRAVDQPVAGPETPVSASALARQTGTAAPAVRQVVRRHDAATPADPRGPPHR